MDKTNKPDFETKHLPKEYDVIAPDKSKIRLLLTMKRGSMVHCTLPPHTTSLAVRHKTVEEIWYFIQGCGEVWRKKRDQEEVVEARPGVCITIPTGTHFQFRNTGNEPLHFVIATMPPWPGKDEAVRVKDYWDPA
ncbi:MAG: cupin domain-containing protein [Candidatus Bathyarchaeia archaeon]